MKNVLLKLIFPSKCIFCEKVIKISCDIELCEECRSILPFLNSMQRRDLFDKTVNKYCDGLVCLFEYKEAVKSALIRYKFYERPGFCRVFAALMAEIIPKMTDCGAFDIIVSVPLFHGRERERGYNQSRLIAKEMGSILMIPEEPHALKRVADTKTQSLLRREERKKNVAGAFAAEERYVADKKILLIDDIFTTGNTVFECCKALKQAGASSVTAAVAATGHGIRKQNSGRIKAE